MFATLVLATFALLTVGGVLLVLRGGDLPGTRARIPAKPVGIVAAAGSGLVFVLVGFGSCVYSQDPGQALVLRSFTGQVVGQDTTDGLGFKPPWVSTIPYDVRNQLVSYIGDGEDEHVNGPAITAQDKDTATASIDVVVRYSLDPSTVSATYRQYGSQQSFEQKVIFNDVRSVVRNIPLNYPTTTFRLQREAAAAAIQDALAQRWVDSGILVESVDLRDIRYPENIENSLQAVQEATNAANKAKADLETAKVNAEKTRVQAQAQADADQIIRCGARTQDATENINGLDTKVTKTIPLQGGECQNRLNEQVLMSKYIDMLAGRNGDTVYVLPKDVNGLLELKK